MDPILEPRVDLVVDLVVDPVVDPVVEPVAGDQLGVDFKNEVHLIRCLAFR